jgi:hypothetical protein
MGYASRSPTSDRESQRRGISVHPSLEIKFEMVVGTKITTAYQMMLTCHRVVR